MYVVNKDCVVLVEINQKVHKLMVATDLLESYGSGRITSSTEECTIGNATYCVVYA